jgi:hypothetical protein
MSNICGECGLERTNMPGSFNHTASVFAGNHERLAHPILKRNQKPKGRPKKTAKMEGGQS